MHTEACSYQMLMTILVWIPPEPETLRASGDMNNTRKCIEVDMGGVVG